MKKLSTYIKESYLNESESKKMSFSFKDLEGAKEFLEKVKDFEAVTTDEEALTLDVNIDNEDAAKSIYTEIKKFCDTIRHSSKRTNDEAYAQKTLKFKHKVDALYDALYVTDEEDDGESEEPKKEEPKKEKEEKPKKEKEEE